MVRVVRDRWVKRKIVRTVLERVVSRKRPRRRISHEGSRVGRGRVVNIRPILQWRSLSEREGWYGFRGRSGGGRFRDHREI